MLGFLLKIKGNTMRNLILSFVILFVPYIKSDATHEAILEISQPNWTENGIVESKTTYLRMGNYMAKTQIGLTTEKNLIDVGGETKNRNLANIFGLKVKIPPGDISLSDTVSVNLQIPTNINVPNPYKNVSINEVVKSTINCLIKNSISHNYCDLKINGSEKFKKYEKVYFTPKIKYSIQVKAFPLSEFENAISYFNSLKDLDLIVYLENATVKNEEFIRIKIGYFDTVREARFTASLIKKIKDIEYFITYCDLRTQTISHKDKILGLKTYSGIWAVRNTSSIELYDFTKNETIINDVYSYNNYKNQLSIYSRNGNKLDEIPITDKLKMLKGN